MPHFILAYYKGKTPRTSEEAASHHAKFEAWIRSLGTETLVKTVPLKSSKLISKREKLDEDDTKRLLGYSILKADALDTVVRIAKNCPHAEIGAIEVAEIER
ncbi:YciI family protein [Puniceicoccaceae bacterium K14]|nr:YciI family protein [Puniceicoccaceae bacterium K14]